MTKDYKEEHELIRQELWVTIASAYVGAANSRHVDGASKWADAVLEQFDTRFKKPKQDESN